MDRIELLRVRNGTDHNTTPTRVEAMEHLWLYYECRIVCKIINHSQIVRNNFLYCCFFRLINNLMLSIEYCSKCVCIAVIYINVIVWIKPGMSFKVTFDWQQTAIHRARWRKHVYAWTKQSLSFYKIVFVIVLCDTTPIALIWWFLSVASRVHHC